MIDLAWCCWLSIGLVCIIGRYIIKVKLKYRPTVRKTTVENKCRMCRMSIVDVPDHVLFRENMGQ